MPVQTVKGSGSEVENLSLMNSQKVVIPAQAGMTEKSRFRLLTSPSSFCF